jgi:HSP20 family protein
VKAKKFSSEKLQFIGGTLKMTTITRIDPFRELATLFENFAEPSAAKDQLMAGSFVPPVDIYEDEHNLVLKLEVPGVNEENLDIQVENNTLSVKGERSFEKDEKEENFHRIERRYGSFFRTFRLPNTVDSEKIEAHYDKGVLKISLAKKAEAKPKQIKVGVSNGVKTIQG